MLKTLGPLLACLILAGCSSDEFDPNGVLESRPVRLDGEQVVLDPGQVDCGAREDLWTVTSLGGAGRSVARLTKKGRDLQFSDDVQIGDPVIGNPYVQLQGSFRLKVLRTGSVRDEDEFTKLVDAKVGVAIEHSCFQGSLPVLMGIKHGTFDPSVNPAFRIELDGGWMVDRVIH